MGEHALLQYPWPFVDHGHNLGLHTRSRVSLLNPGVDRHQRPHLHPRHQTPPPHQADTSSLAVPPILSAAHLPTILHILHLPTITLVLKAASLGVYNYIPAGLATVAFAALSAWRDEIPRLYRYKIVTSTGTGTGTVPDGQQVPGIVFSDKSTTYLLAAQLALSQFPYQLLPAAVGWTIGSAWMGELLPGGLGRWRIPSWIVGETSKRKERGRYEGLRRRLEEEGSSADGMRNVSDNVDRVEGSGRRGFGRQILGYFTGS